MISEDGVASTTERRRERVAGFEKKASQEGGSRGKVRRTSDGDKSDKSPSTRPNGKISKSKNEITLARERDCDANGTDRRSKEAATLLHTPVRELTRLASQSERVSFTRSASGRRTSGTGRS